MKFLPAALVVPAHFETTPFRAAAGTRDRRRAAPSQWLLPLPLSLVLLLSTGCSKPTPTPYAWRTYGPTRTETRTELVDWTRGWVGKCKPAEGEYEWRSCVTAKLDKMERRLRSDLDDWLADESKKTAEDDERRLVQVGDIACKVNPAARKLKITKHTEATVACTLRYDLLIREMAGERGKRRQR